MRVAVVGAGIGGLTFALAAQTRGIDTVIHERARLLGEAGAGIQLGPNAVKVLDRLGLGDAVRATAFRPEAVEVRQARGAGLLLRTELGATAERRWGAPYLQIHRSDLQALLLAAVRERGAGELRLGSAIRASAGAGARLQDGGEVDADVIIGADGLRSTVAESLFGAQAPRFTGQVAWRATVPAARVEGSIPPVAAVWTAPHAHVVHYPVRGGREINLVAVTAERAWREEGWTVPGDRAALRGVFAGWPSPVPELLSHVGEVWRWALFDRPPRARWSVGSTTLMGDAAHPMLPFLAQGAAMAIEDAWVLASHLGGTDPPSAAFLQYEAERRPRTSRVQAWSRRNAVIFHLPDLLSRAAFGAAATFGPPTNRLDWLYGWSPT